MTLNLFHKTEKVRDHKVSRKYLLSGEKKKTSPPVKWYEGTQHWLSHVRRMIRTSESVGAFEILKLITFTFYVSQLYFHAHKWSSSPFLPATQFVTFQWYLDLVTERRKISNILKTRWYWNISTVEKVNCPNSPFTCQEQVSGKPVLWEMNDMPESPNKLSPNCPEKVSKNILFIN